MQQIIVFEILALSLILPVTLLVPHPSLNTSNQVKLRTANFEWTYPWLCVRVGANVASNTSPHNFVREVERHRFWPIEYILEDRMGLHGVALFLSSLVYHKSEIPETEVPRFEGFRKFLSMLHPASVKLSNLHILLNDFKRRDALSMAEGSEIDARINTTDAGGVWMVAVRAKHLFPIVAILFPRRMRSIVRNEDDGKEAEKGESFKVQLQDALEDLAENEPWKLGFEELTYKRTRRSCPCPVSKLEAPFYLMSRASFCSKLTALQKDALTLYDAVKNWCKKNGHTYVTQTNMEYLVGDEIEDITSVVNFLLDHEILRKDLSWENVERFHLGRNSMALNYIIRVFAKNRKHISCCW